MQVDAKIIQDAARRAESRFDLWIQLLRQADVRTMAEIGVWRGDFAEAVLAACPSIRTYYMIDPWRHLDIWNKPSNADDGVFEAFLAEALDKTAFASDRRVVLRGTTTEVADRISDESLDFAYLDGDHTLRGITIDLIRVYQKVRIGGWLGGDDLTETIWEHNSRFEPTLVFPVVIHFAEAMAARIVCLPHNQFLIEKTAVGAFEVIDLTGRYSDATLGHQLRSSHILRRRTRDALATVPGQKRLRVLARQARASARAFLSDS